MDCDVLDAADQACMARELSKGMTWGRDAKTVGLFRLNFLYLVLFEDKARDQLSLFITGIKSGMGYDSDRSNRSKSGQQNE